MKDSFRKIKTLDETINFVYLDESGDLGFSKGSSKYFVISFIAMDSKTNLMLDRKIKTIRQKRRLKRNVEIKASNSSNSLRVNVLCEICSLPIKIYSITVNKQGVYESLREGTNILYNYMTNLILVPYVEQEKIDNICIIADLRINRIYRGMRFGNYLKYKIFYEKGLRNKKLDIKYLDSFSSNALQAVDYVAFGFFRKYERGQNKYYEILKERIIEDKNLYFSSETKEADPGGN